VLEPRAVSVAVVVLAIALSAYAPSTTAASVKHPPTFIARISPVALATRITDQSATKQVDYAAPCARCLIQQVQIATFGRESDPDLIGGTGTAARDRKGRMFIPGFDRLRVVVFDSGGRYITAIGGRGDGPGEFGTATLRGIAYLAIGRGDSLFAFTATGRVNVFGPDLRFARTFKIPVANTSAIVLLRNGDILVGGSAATRERIGLPYHVLDSSGEFRRSFGGDGRIIGRGAPPPFPAMFALSPDEKSMWIAEFNHIREFHLDGSRGLDLELVNVPWMPPAVATKIEGIPSRAGKTERTTTRLLSTGSITVAGIDSAGLIWIRGQGWSGAPSLTVDPRAIKSYLFAIDPRTSSVVANLPVKQAFRFLGNSTQAMSSAADSVSGVVSRTLWRLTVVRR